MGEELKEFHDEDDDDEPLNTEPFEGVYNGGSETNDGICKNEKVLKIGDFIVINQIKV